MLSEVPETLRQVTINVYNLPSMETINDKQVLGLHKFDTAFPERQFPFLEKVHLRVAKSPYYRDFPVPYFPGNKRLSVYGRRIKRLSRTGMLLGPPTATSSRHIADY